MSLIPQLENDLVTAASRLRPRPRLVPRTRRATVAVALAALALAAAAAAASGIIRIGSVIPGDGFFGVGSNKVTEKVLAMGDAPHAGGWKITTFRSGMDARCLKLTLLDASNRRLGPPRSGYCGHIGSFEALGYGSRSQAARRGSVIVWGPAPRAAQTVQLTAADRVKITVPAQPGPADDRRRYWLIEAPTGLKRPSVAWLDANGQTGRTPIDLTFRFSAPFGRTVVLTGNAPLAGPWRLIVYESGRHLSKGDLYEPEGLPCLELSLPKPKVGFPSRGGGCGELRNAPGFIRGQHTVRNKNGKSAGEIVIYGQAPAQADRVEIAKKGQPRLSTETHVAPKGVPGRFWLIATSPAYSGGHMAWFSEDGRTRGPAVEVLPP